MGLILDLGVVGHAYNTNIWEAETEGSEFEASLGYEVRYCKNKTNQQPSSLIWTAAAQEPTAHIFWLHSKWKCWKTGDPSILEPS